MRDDGKITPNAVEIKRLRKKNLLSQEDLSAATGVSLKSVRYIESDPTYRCRFGTIGTLASFFRVEPQSILAEDGAGIIFLSKPQEIVDAKIEITASAKKTLACVGSRARNASYLRQTENTLQKNPDLVYYRVMTGPLFSENLRDHLIRIIVSRKPTEHEHGAKKTHIGLFRDHARQPECSLCASESMVLIGIPSMFGAGEFTTALLLQNRSHVEHHINLTKTLYKFGQAIENEEAVRKLGIAQAVE